MKLTAYDTMSFKCEIDFLTDHMKECREKHRKIDTEFLKFHAKTLYDLIVQAEMLNGGKGVPRYGIDTPAWEKYR